MVVMLLYITIYNLLGDWKKSVALKRSAYMTSTFCSVCIVEYKSKPIYSDESPAKI